MEKRPARPSLRLQRTLSKQASVVDDERDEGIVTEVVPVSNGSPVPSESSPQPPPQAIPSSTSELVPPTSTITASPTLTITTSSPGPLSSTEPSSHGQDKSRVESPINLHNCSNGSNNPSLNSSNQRSKSLDLPKHQNSLDMDKDQPLVTSARHRHHGGKFRQLQRSHAMREDSSPPPDYREPSPIQCHPSTHSCSNNTLTVGGRRRGFRHQGSSQGSYDSSSPCLSRDSSMEYTDSSGVDLQQFIIQTLHKNQKDRMMLLKIEHELISLVKDSKRTHHKFGPMSSYQRMLVHRCAAFFGLEHNVDQAGTAVIVNKTRCTRLPDIRFRDHCRDDFLSPDEPKRSILKRDSCSFDDGSGYKSSDREHSSDSRRSKSFEEREEDYVKVRRRIFSQESLCSMDGLLDSPERRHDSRRNSQDEPRWHDSRHWNFMDSENHHRKHQHDNQRLRPCRLPKVESFESRETLHPRSLRPPVFKSHSFGGYSGGVTVLSRGDSVSSNVSSSRLSKQDSTSSRISDHSSSSGYKTQRQDTSSTSVSNTLSTTPSPTTSHHQQQPSFGVWGGEGDSQPVMWAVTDMEAVPAGAMLINPQSGQPYVNDDGSVYRFDPNNPPTVSCSSSIDQDNAEKEELSEKHRSSPASSDSCHGREVPSGTSPQEVEPSISSSESSTTTPSASLSRNSSQQQKQETPDQNQAAVSKESSNQESSSTEGNTVSNPPQVIYSHYYNHQSLETKQYSQDGICADISGQLRSLCISGGAGAGNGSGEGAADPSTPLTPASVTPAQHNLIMSRHQYSQPVYYLPPSSNVNGTGVKYVYPQYQMAPVGPQAVTGLPAAAMQPVQALPGVAAVQAVPAPAPVPAPPCAPTHPPSNPTAIDPANPPVGYLPGGYTVVTYPTPGGVVPGTTGAAQESGGTTYYYQVPVGGNNNVNGAAPIIPQSNLQQPYAITSTPSTTSFPHSLHGGILYSGGGVGGGGGGGMYQSIGSMAAAAAAAGSISAAGGVYATNGQGTAASAAAAVSAAAAAAAAAAAVPPHPPPACHSTAVSYRNPTPPQTPTTQMVGGAVATPPPHQLLQFGVPGVPPPPPPGSLTPHPPVFAKPYIGTTTVHNIVGASAPFSEHPVLNKDDGRRLLSLGAGNMAAAAAAVAHNNQVIAATQFLQQNQMNSNNNTAAAHAQLLARPYSIMQNDMRVLGSNGGVCGVSGGFPAGPGFAPGSHVPRAGPIFLTGARPRHPVPAAAFATAPIPPFNISRPPKIRRQRSRSSYVRSCDVLTPQLSVDSQDTNETI